jgi:hypothetical protein
MTTPTHPLPPIPGRTLTRWSAWGLALLLPGILFTSIAVLSTERGTRCVTNGECPQVPGALVYGSLMTAVVAGLAALVWPRRTWTGARTWAVVLQWTAQALLMLLILSYGA